jgi:hypothetical protein
MPDDPYYGMPKIPGRLWSKMRHMDQIIAVRLTDGRVIDKVAVSNSGAIVGIDVGGYSGVDPGAIDFSPQEIVAIKRRDSIIDLLGFGKWIVGTL